MEAVGVMAEWKSTMKVIGNEHATATGAGQKQKWCAERLTVVHLSLRRKISILESHVVWLESKLPVQGMRALSHSAEFKNSRKIVLMLPLSVQVSLLIFPVCLHVYKQDGKNLRSLNVVQERLEAKHGL